MIKIKLSNGRDHLDMDKLVFGTGSFTDYSSEEQYFALMDKYCKAFRTFDTARSYNEWLPGSENISEYMLGKWMSTRKNRKNTIVVTKGGFPKNLKLKKDVVKRINKEDLTYDLDLSLKTLDTDYVDVFLLHRDDEDKKIEEIMPILNDFVKQGKARFTGVSNWSCKRLSEAVEFTEKESMEPLVISQCYFSLASSNPARFEDETIVCINDDEYVWYEKNKMPLMAFTSQAKGFFSKYCMAPLTQKEIMRFLSQENIERAKRAMLLADEYSVSPTCIALAYLTNNKVQTAAILGCRNMEQLDDSLKADDILLSDAQIDWLKGL